MPTQEQIKACAIKDCGKWKFADRDEWSCRALHTPGACAAIPDPTPPPTMKLFHWNRIMVLANYAPGDLIVMAEDAEAARKIGREVLTAKVKDTWDYAFDNDDDDWKDIRDEKLALIESDMAAEPDIVESGVVVVRGSD